MPGSGTGGRVGNGIWVLAGVVLLSSFVAKVPKHSSPESGPSGGTQEQVNPSTSGQEVTDSGEATTVPPKVSNSGEPQYAVLHIDDPNCTNSGIFPNTQANHWFGGVLTDAGFEYGKALDYINKHPKAASAVAHFTDVQIICG